jgi:hypothetical protein
VVPIVPPSRADRPYAREQQEEAAHRLRAVSTEPSSSEAGA